MKTAKNTGSPFKVDFKHKLNLINAHLAIAFLLLPWTYLHNQLGLFMIPLMIAIICLMYLIIYNRFMVLLFKLFSSKNMFKFYIDRKKFITGELYKSADGNTYYYYMGHQWFYKAKNPTPTEKLLAEHIV